MKKISIVIVVLLLVASVAPGHAQQSNPVHLDYSVKKTNDKVFELHVNATMDEGWHIYARVQPKSAISVPTTFTFIKSPLITLQGKVKEIGTIEKQKIPEVGIEQNMYEKNVGFVQALQIKAKIKTNLMGSITYQACTNEMCLPVKTVDFIVPVQ